MSESTRPSPCSTSPIVSALAELSGHVLALVADFRQRGPSPLSTFDFEKKSPSFCVSVAASFAKACSTTSNPTTTPPAQSEFSTPTKPIGVAIKAQT